MLALLVLNGGNDCFDDLGALGETFDRFFSSGGSLCPATG
jgi:hypothetical protein